MPLYEFACESCGTRFDAMKRMNQRHEAEPCPDCGKAGFLRIAAAAVLSGAAACGKASDAPSCCSREGGRCPY